MDQINIRRYFLTAFIFLMTVLSCAQAPPVKDGAGMIIRASTEIESLVAVTKTLHASGVISSSYKAKVKRSLLDAMENLRLARVYLGQGDIDAVEARVSIAMSIINTVRGWLDEKRDHTRTKDYPRWVRLA